MHMAQLMPLPLTVSCFSKIQIGFTSLVPAHSGSPGKRAVKRVCVCANARLAVSIFSLADRAQLIDFNDTQSAILCAHDVSKAQTLAQRRH